MKTPAPFHPSRRDFLRLLSAGGFAMAGSQLVSQGEQPAAQPDEKKVGVALCCLGRYSERELGPALKLTRHCQLTAVITGTPAKGPKWMKDYDLPEGAVYSYETMDRIADNKAIDYVYVVSPPGIRRELVERCAKAGKHVIAEKPLATTVEDCDAMIAACRKANRKLSTGYRLHFDPYHQEMMRIAREKEFGELKKMTGYRAFEMRERQWRVDRKLAGGGPLMDLGVYLVQAGCMIAGTPVSVTAQELPKKKPELFNEVEEAIHFTMDFSNGARLDAETSYNGRGDRFRADGDKGFWEFPERAFTYRGASCVTSRGPITFGRMNQQAAHMDDFARCIRDDRESVVSGEMGRRDVVIMLAIYEAARTGKPVQVKV